MAAKMKVRKIGNSVGLILPKEVADQLRVGEDDTVHYTVDTNGLHVTPFDPDFDAAMEAFGQTRRRYRNALRSLAKKPQEFVMAEPIWVPLRAVIAIQAELIAEHGGLTGPPRQGDLEAALGRPVNLHAYSESPSTLPRLAAAYGFALARGHCFPDGNKRVALAIIDVFLRMNGRELTADEMDAADTIQSLAARDLTEDDLADWIAAHSGPRG